MLAVMYRGLPARTLSSFTCRYAVDTHLPIRD